jgi:hypothetical protein
VADLTEGLRNVASIWEAEQVDVAVTGAIAAQALAPYLTSVTVAEVYVAVDTVAACVCRSAPRWRPW